MIFWTLTLIVSYLVMGIQFLESCFSGGFKYIYYAPPRTDDCVWKDNPDLQPLTI